MRCTSKRALGLGTRVTGRIHAGNTSRAASFGIGGGAGAMRATGVGEKIPPHQQPRASDLPAASGNNSYVDQLTAEDKALDRRLKGICRGC